MKWGWITIQPTAAKNGSQQKIIQSAERTPLVKCLKSHSIPIFLDEIWLKSPFSSLQGQSPRVSKVPETTTYILGSAGSWRFRWDDLLGVFFTWFAGIWWGFLVDFLGFEMILMGFFDGSSMGIFFLGGILPGTVKKHGRTPLRSLRDVDLRMTWGYNPLTIRGMSHQVWHGWYGWILHNWRCPKDFLVDRSYRSVVF